MPEILAYMPTFSPATEATSNNRRPYERLPQHEIVKRINELQIMSREKPWLYMDCIDSILNTRPDIELVVADARSTDSIRDEMHKHYVAGGGKYHLGLYPEKLSQWEVFNDVMHRHMTDETKYVVYTSSDIVWGMDWVGEAVKEFERDAALMIIFPTVSSGDFEFLPCQVRPGPVDEPLMDPPYQDAARAPVLNAYAMIFRADFFRAYGGYMTAYRNCFTESFLYYQCEAMGWKMRLMPRGWLFHHNAGDAWASSEGGHYHYLAEKPKFDVMMDAVQVARVEGRMTHAFLREVLYPEGGWRSEFKAPLERIMQG